MSLEVPLLASDASGDAVGVTARTMTWHATAVVLIADLIGVGVLGMPKAFANLGWIGASLLLLLCTLGNGYTGLLIVRSVRAAAKARVPRGSSTPTCAASRPACETTAWAAT